MARKFNPLEFNMVGRMRQDELDLEERGVALKEKESPSSVAQAEAAAKLNTANALFVDAQRTLFANKTLQDLDQRFKNEQVLLTKSQRKEIKGKLKQAKNWMASDDPDVRRMGEEVMAGIGKAQSDAQMFEALRLEMQGMGLNLRQLQFELVQQTQGRKTAEEKLGVLTDNAGAIKDLAGSAESRAKVRESTARTLEEAGGLEPGTLDADKGSGGFGLRSAGESVWNALQAFSNSAVKADIGMKAMKAAKGSSKQSSTTPDSVTGAEVKRSKDTPFVPSRKTKTPSVPTAPDASKGFKTEGGKLKVSKDAKGREYIESADGVKIYVGDEYTFNGVKYIYLGKGQRRKAG